MMGRIEMDKDNLGTSDSSATGLLLRRNPFIVLFAIQLKKTLNVNLLWIAEN